MKLDSENLSSSAIFATPILSKLILSGLGFKVLLCEKWEIIAPYQGWCATYQKQVSQQVLAIGEYRGWGVVVRGEKCHQEHRWKKLRWQRGVLVHLRHERSLEPMTPWQHLDGSVPNRWICCEFICTDTFTYNALCPSVKQEDQPSKYVYENDSSDFISPVFWTLARKSWP